jgi:hypothetical protein
MLGRQQSYVKYTKINKNYTDKMKLDQVIQSVPTIGFNVETCKFKNLTF